MSAITLINAYEAPSKKKTWKPRTFTQAFSLTGYFSYAFIYGSWEVIRARKMGTTRTNVDYVVYRLFYPVVLLGVCLFGVVQQDNLGKFFSMIEVWTMILHISYAFIFLQNCLQNNLHRDKVKHRQVIPERLIVTDEIEKGGSKFYICKRFSILPSDRLYTRESFIYLLFNVVVTANVCHLLSYFAGTTRLAYDHNEDLQRTRLEALGGMALADAFLTPIPMRIAHAIYPMLYYGTYLAYSYLLFSKKGIVLYTHLNWTDSKAHTSRHVILRLLGVFIIHCILVGLCSLRDHIISSLDNSQGSKQVQSLRAQKRLARRKIMNYIEGPDGRIVGIKLEKNSYVPKMHEVVQTEKNKSKARKGYEKWSDSSSDDTSIRGEGEPIRKKSRPDRFHDENAIPVTAKVMPPPQPRYKTRYVREFRLSSSSSDEEFKKTRELKEIKDIQFPTPPKNNVNSGKDKPSKIPIRIQKLGLPVRKRDSKENIQHKLYEEDSPPTPPFVKLVQAMVRVHKATKKEVEEHKKKLAKNQTTTGPNDLAPEKVVAVVEQNAMDYGIKKLPDSQRYAQPRKDMKGKPKVGQDLTKNLTLPSKPLPNFGATAKPKAPRIINVASGKVESPVDVMEKGGNKIQTYEQPNDANDFHTELTKKLEVVKKKTESKPEPTRQPIQDVNIIEEDTELVNYNVKPRGILKTGRRESQIKRREVKLIKRREERITTGKRGKPPYDPLSVPDIEQETMFHYLGTKLKKDFKPALIKEDLHLFQKHPGLPTVDDENQQQTTRKTADAARSLVAFHPIVKYYKVNEKRQSEDKSSEKKFK